MIWKNCIFSSKAIWVISIPLWGRKIFPTTWFTTKPFKIKFLKKKPFPDSFAWSTPKPSIVTVKSFSSRPLRNSKRSLKVLFVCSWYKSQARTFCLSEAAQATRTRRLYRRKWLWNGGKGQEESLTQLEWFRELETLLCTFFIRGMTPIPKCSSLKETIGSWNMSWKNGAGSKIATPKVPVLTSSGPWRPRMPTGPPFRTTRLWTIFVIMMNIRPKVDCHEISRI